MKKNVKAIFAGLAAAALLAGFSSCSNGSSDDSLNKPAGTSSGANQTDTNNDEVFSGDLITYVISVASTDSENTKLILQYDRSAAGAKEQISLTDADLALAVNGAAVDTPKTITFALDAYSSFEKEAGKEETDASKQKTYKCTIDLKKQLSVNDKVTLQLNKAKVTGEGASSVKLGSIVATIVDIAPAAKYWRELSETKYQTLITKKNGADLNATVAVEEPANPTPANNTPENPAPENPTPANNTSTPAANATTYSGNLITFTAKEASADATNTVLLIKYDRSSAGANEKITLNNVNLEVKIDNNPITMPTSLEFNLDVNGSKFDDNATGTDNLKEYKIKLPLGVQLATNNVVKVQLKSSNLSENSAQNVNLASIAVALIDTAESVGWYKELSDNEYQPLISLN